MIPEEMYQALIVESKKIGTFGHGFTYSGTRSQPQSR